MFTIHLSSFYFRQEITVVLEKKIFFLLYPSRFEKKKKLQISSNEKENQLFRWIDNFSSIACKLEFTVLETT